MKPPEFDYVAPGSLEEAVSLLGANPDAKALAGGQSLIPLLAFRLASPPLLVDLARIPGLDRVEQRERAVSIGAMARQAHAHADPFLRARCPLLVEALGYVAHPQIRTRGTVGGSVAHADPAAEIPAVLLALDGRVRVAGPAGERTIEARDLFQGFLTTALAAGEVLTAVELPLAPPRTGWACVEIARRPGDYALCGAVCQVTRGDDGAVSDARLALVAVGDRPVRAAAAERALVGGASTAEAARHAVEGLSPSDDVQASAEYRVHLAGVVARRAFEQALARAA
jgi:carbon-monoxide dehydrogenase medium subunit